MDLTLGWTLQTGIAHVWGNGGLIYVGNACRSMRMYMCMFMCVCLHVDLYVYVYVDVLVQVHVDLYDHVSLHMHTAT